MARKDGEAAASQASTMRRLLVSWHHMLWAETDSYHSSRDSAQHRKFFKQPRGQWWSHLLSCLEDALKEMLMHKDLHTLRKVRGPLATALHSAQIV